MKSLPFYSLGIGILLILLLLFIVATGQAQGLDPVLVLPDPTPEATPVVGETPVVVVPAEDIQGMVSETTLHIALVFFAVILVGLGLFADRVIKRVAGLVPPDALPTIYSAADSAFGRRQVLLDSVYGETLKTADPFDDQLVGAARSASRAQWAKLKADAKLHGIVLPDLPPDVDSVLVQLSDK